MEKKTNVLERTVDIAGEVSENVRFSGRLHNEKNEIRGKKVAYIDNSPKRM